MTFLRSAIQVSNGVDKVSAMVNVTVMNIIDVPFSTFGRFIVFPSNYP